MNYKLQVNCDLIVNNNIDLMKKQTSKDVLNFISFQKYKQSESYFRSLTHATFVTKEIFNILYIWWIFRYGRLSK